jgi:hypothetical protein
VTKELHNFNWIKSLKQINSVELLDEFILLFSALSEVLLNYEKDDICWRWNNQGVYTASSAYDIQFLGAHPQFTASTIWQAKTEPKCQFFFLAGHPQQSSNGRQHCKEGLAL